MTLVFLQRREGKALDVGRYTPSMLNAQVRIFLSFSCAFYLKILTHITHVSEVTPNGECGDRVRRCEGQGLGTRLCPGACLNLSD